MWHLLISLFYAVGIVVYQAFVGPHDFFTLPFLACPWRVARRKVLQDRSVIKNNILSLPFIVILYRLLNEIWKNIIILIPSTFSSSPCVQTGSGAHPASYPVGTGGPFPGGKARPGRDADHSPPSSAEVKYE
jgi:hypothetical protein